MKNSRIIPFLLSVATIVFSFSSFGIAAFTPISVYADSSASSTVGGTAGSVADNGRMDTVKMGNTTIQRGLVALPADWNVSTMIEKVKAIIIVVSMLALVILVTYGGFGLIMSGMDASALQVDSSRSTIIKGITSAVVGFVFIYGFSSSLLAWSIKKANDSGGAQLQAVLKSSEGNMLEPRLFHMSKPTVQIQSGDFSLITDSGSANAPQFDGQGNVTDPLTGGTYALRINAKTFDIFTCGKSTGVGTNGVDTCLDSSLTTFISATTAAQSLDANGNLVTPSGQIVMPASRLSMVPGLTNAYAQLKANPPAPAGVIVGSGASAKFNDIMNNQ